MPVIEQVSGALQTILTTTAEQVGAACRIIRRKREFTAATLAQTLVFGFLQNPRAGDESLAQTASLCGVPVTPQAVAQRFTWPLVEFLQGLLAAAVQQVVTAQPVAIPLLQKFNGVYIQDSTGVPLPAEMVETFPGSGGNGPAASVKVQTRLELQTGKLDYVGLEPGRQPDQATALQQEKLPAGSLRLADLGYFCVAVLAELARQGVFWISRIQSGTAVFCPDDPEWDFHRWLQEEVTGPVREKQVLLGAGERLPCRLLAWRAPQEVADRRRRRLYADCRRKGRTPSAARLAWCNWTVFVTNTDAEQLTPQEVVVLYRVRWQIELLFKLWKSHGLVGAVTSPKPARQAAETFARLLAVMVQHWLLVTSVWQYAGRSLVKAARLMRGFVTGLALALHDSILLRRQIAALCDSLRKSARISKRKRKPSTYQLLLQPELSEF